MPVNKLTISPGVDQYTLINKNKTLAVMVLTYGAIVSHILTPDKTGTVRDVVLGFDDHESYKHPDNPYFGAVVGRYGNRIGKGKFTADGKEYQLAINNGPNALHGGLEGFDKRIWTATVLSEEPASVRLELVSPDGDQGYPGTLTTSVTYTVNDKDELIMEYHATTDKETVVNLTNHSYFNLSGVSLNPNILDHRVTMTDEVKAVLECDQDCLPTGKVLSWSEVPWMNFSGENAGKSIGARFEKLEATRGYDHPYVIHTDYKTDTAHLPLRHAVTVYSPDTGIEMDFSTTEPAFQFYTGGWIASDVLEAKKDQGKIKLGPSAGFCLEASRNPDSPNKPEWRNAVLLQKEGVYTGKTVYAFHARLN
ncbi:aldose 1-epimerase [Cokeromyces recurvatus]|uniref:aldose 1-epimerase n=1 Tax=Cokeromyces recurvatus TaxID=90255 RepID=UPI00222053FA|nr:aldose 1-epimerase [Cokeromyces recurvatus]KAI7904216.1 aldose 1-epimerase [Cokeromyces recurvatus]